VSIGAGRSARDDLDMPIAIRCHPCTPVEPDEIQRWLERELSRVRDKAGGGAVRLLRLTQDLPSGEYPIGWLVEIDVDDDVFDSARLAEVMSDMKLLGLQPTVLESAEAPA
jgi:hypothetical protein